MCRHLLPSRRKTRLQVCLGSYHNSRNWARKSCFLQIRSDTCGWAGLNTQFDGQSKTRDKELWSSTLLTTFYGQKTKAPQLPPHMGRLLRCSSPIDDQDSRTNSKRTVPQSTYSTCSDFHLLWLLRRLSIAISSPHRQINRAMPEVRRAACMVCLLLYVVGGLGPIESVLFSALSSAGESLVVTSVYFGSTFVWARI